MPTQAYTYLHILTHTYTYLHMPTHAYTNIHIPTHTYTYLQKPTHTYTYLYIPTHAYTNIHKPTHTYTYLAQWLSHTESSGRMTFCPAVLHSYLLQGALNFAPKQSALNKYNLPVLLQ